VLLGDPNNPESGIYALQKRVSEHAVLLHPDSAGHSHPTDIYTIQYDGYADFPKYPIDLLTDINAGMGMDYAHLDYATLTSEQLATAVELPTSPGCHLVKRCSDQRIYRSAVSAVRPVIGRVLARSLNGSPRVTCPVSVQTAVTTLRGRTRLPAITCVA
jgi:hypothetical protein